MKNIVLLLSVFLAACGPPGMIRNEPPLNGHDRSTGRLQYPYEPSTNCRVCHPDQYQQYEESMHAKAFSNPLFNAQYFNDVVPRARRDPMLAAEARRCIACHAPAVFMNYTGLVTTPEQAYRYETGVTCDFCHTLGGYAGNGDYLQVASGRKQGPYQITGSASHHSEYSGFMQLAEYCGRCHNATNHVGLEVKSTFDEWRESGYGMSGGITCQECHMSKDGFLHNGTAEFASGAAASINIGFVARKQKEHDRLYSHSFPGAHSKSQQRAALLLDFRFGARTLDAGGLIPFVVLVDNRRTGHKMPSGSSDLRFMWLVVTATALDGTVIPFFPHASTADADYSIAGASPDDAAILGDDVPAGSRLYRAVLVNAAGRQSLFQYDAVKMAFDNRLAAKEIRRESYYLMPPPAFSGEVTLEASLYYKSAPGSFTKRMQVPDFTPVLVTTKKKQITIETSHPGKK